MTQRDVQRAKAMLEARGDDATPTAIHALIGSGTRAQVQQHLRRLRERQRGRQARARPGPRSAPSVATQLEAAHLPRDREAAELDAFIAARRGQGYGPPVAGEPPPVYEEEEPRGTEGRVHAKARALVRSLLEEAVPWLCEPHA